MKDIERLILTKIVNDERFARKVLPFIKSSYFEGKKQLAYEFVLDFMVNYNALPTKNALLIEFNTSTLNVEANQDVIEIFDEITQDEEVNEEWLLKNTEQWCKDRALFLAIMKSIEIMDGREKDLATGAIPDILQKALGVSFDRSVGHDYLDDADDRYKFYHEDIARIPFDIEMLNKITKGGVVRKSLNILMAGTGVGKTIGLCHLAANYLSQGLNVLYITLEMSEERIAERIDANLLDIDIGDLNTVSSDEYFKAINKIKGKTQGKLIIKEYPTAAAHTGHFRALCNELKLKKNFIPDIILIDYLNICASSRIKALGGSINTYSYVKAIAEEVRGLAVEQDVPIWSATQVNRTGFNSSDVELTDTSESFGLPATSDLFLALITSEQLESLNQIMIKQLKNRYNDMSFHRRFVIGVDKPKMRWYDVEETAQNDILPEISEYTIGTSEDKDDIVTDDWKF